jgi:hypothetical protein
MSLRTVFGRFGGVVMAAAYALSLRLIFHFPYGKNVDFDSYSLFSVTFVWIVPIIIGVVPMIFATNEQIKSYYYRIVAPVNAVLVFFAVCFMTRIEDLLCIIIMCVPFFFGAMISGLLFGKLVEKYRKNKGLMFSIAAIPLLLCPLENLVETPSDVHTIRTSIVITSSPEVIWKNIIRVKQIEEHEYSKGFFNYIGIPRPMFAELDHDSAGAIRTGHFEGGLIFKETVREWKKNEKISFDINIVPSSIRSTVFDQHVLKGNHFKFLNASYNIKQIDSRKMELVLLSSYELDTNINTYASFWGNIMLSDFQTRLLQVIRRRSEQNENPL